MPVEPTAIRTMPVLDPITEPLVPIVCDILEKRLALAGAGGIYLWCKWCHREHLVSWELYDRLRDQAQSRPNFAECGENGRSSG